MNDQSTPTVARGFRYVGKPALRSEAIDKVTGTWIYGADLALPGMLHAKVLRSPYPHARIVSIDLRRARSLSGVRAVVTGDDVPYLFGSAIRDEPFLARGKVRYAGEPVAAVAASSESIAREAIDLIEVEYAELAGVFDPLEAMEPGAVLVHEDLGSYEMEAAFNRYPGSNIVGHSRIRRGDIEQGFRESEAVFEDVFTTQYVQHCSMEGHVCAAQLAADGGVTVWSSCQSPYNFLRDLAKALGLPYSRVRVIATGVGGAFGAKMYLRAEPLTVALAMRSDGRPVKYAHTREEEFVGAVVKHPAHLTFKTGVKRDGTMVARKVTAVYNTGAYGDAGPQVARNSAFSGTGPYRIPHVWIDSYCVYTNNPIGGAFRGFGVPQATWAHESQMDMIAHRLGIDPVEMRMRNLLEPGDATCTGEVLYTSVGAKQTLRRAIEASGYGTALPAASSARVARGRGLATMHKLTNTPTNSTAIVKMHQDGTVNLVCSSVELGQGINTVFRQIVAERLGIPMEHISIGSADTHYTPYDQSTSGSRSVFHMGNAMLRAADDLARQLCELAAPLLDAPVERLEFRDGGVAQIGSMRLIPAKEIIERRFGARGNTLNGEGSFTPPGAQPPDKETGQSSKMSAFWMYATHVADVEVDLETGKVRVLKVVAAHDAGTIIHPEGAEGQIEGGVVQGIGATLCEEMRVSDGIVTNASFAEYKIPTTMDAPEIVPLLVEVPHAEGPYGAKGLAEPALAPTAPAIANAIFNATGARVTSLPITPEKLLRALKQAGK
ncbi:MAG: xanthine dehydrogenase family protein molybdopterin-binding subunit [Betaproteobacteria bacterium]|nr:xanthine dehydrogenase family protein molybdopterin-binding subunit [Betaproteobacteria bacterium]